MQTQDTTKTTDKHTKNQRRGNSVFGFLHFVLVIVATLVTVWAIRTFVAEPFIIPSESMLNTLQVGDYVLGVKAGLKTGHDPERGDIITFWSPVEEDTILIKRVIATEGETIDLNDQGQVLIDGKVLNESYVTAPTHPLDGGLTFPYTVPEDCVFVMGDNRGNSADSRLIGAIPISSVTSIATAIYWPPSDVRSLR